MYGLEVSPEDQQKEGAYLVSLNSCGNPDRHQNPDQPLYGVKPKLAAAKTMAEASKICREYIAANELGGGNWAGGAIWLCDVLVANVSYNGRVWWLPVKEADADVAKAPKAPAKPKK